MEMPLSADSGISLAAWGRIVVPHGTYAGKAFDGVFAAAGAPRYRERSCSSSWACSLKAFLIAKDDEKEAVLKLRKIKARLEDCAGLFAVAAAGSSDDKDSGMDKDKDKDNDGNAEGDKLETRRVILDVPVGSTVTVNFPVPHKKPEVP